MPQTAFICPDGQHCEFSACLKKCRLNERCNHISFLRQAAKVRKWTGTPSVTQLMNGTLQSYLEITNNFASEPDNHVYAILGTAVHTLLEQDMDRLVSKYGFSGLPDWYEDGELHDFKVSSAFVGQNTIDKWKLQVNTYRILLEEAGQKVTRMRIFVIQKDAKKTRGQKATRWIEVERQDNAEILSFFTNKVEKLQASLNLQIPPEECTPEERWYNPRSGSIKCKFYCAVNYLCPYYNTEG